MTPRFRPRQPPAKVRAPAPRNAVARALAGRRASNAAGKHLRSTAAQRRAERVALEKRLKGGLED